MTPMLRAVALMMMAGAAPAQAQSGRGCVSAHSLQLQPIVVVPEVGGFSYRLQVYNAGGVPRGFSYHFPLPLLTPPQEAVYGFQIRPRQTIMIQLGSTLQRATDAALQSNLRITCHS